ncbi:glycosyltransferase family 39 protein [Pseudomonas gingeri]|uniref:glycosyltransferase family 39 protein n=1 Tax=Pseudomonas gingeri TaxID=117681 RepID=UPI00159FFAFE|nr:glycosyltransferase family 39 protein [Pseudomonas gingeri]NWA27015.1 glycosyltransferase family 39 protein [Pseudomonas gingeri]
MDAKKRYGGILSNLPWLSEKHLWVLVLSLAIGVRFYAIQNPYFWTDEAFSALMSVQSPERIWFHTGHDVHPPLYFLLLHAWIAVCGDGVFSQRAMSALAGVLSTLLGMWLMRLLDTPRTAVLAGLFLALFPIAVRYSQEARMYTLEFVWLLGATIALVYWLKNTRDRYLVAYALLMTAALYTHYFALFCVLSHWVYLSILALQKNPPTRPVFRSAWWLANISIALLYVPWLISPIDEIFFNTEQFRIGGDIFWIPKPTAYTLPSSIWKFFSLRDRLDLFTPGNLLFPLFICALALAGAFQIKGRFKFGLLLSLHTFLPIFSVFLLSFIFPVFMERYVAFAALGLPMLLAVAISRLANRTPLLALSAILLILSVQLIGLQTLYAQQDELDDPRNEQANPIDEIVAYIDERFLQGDSIVVQGGYQYLSVAYYNRKGVRPLLFEPPWDATHHNRPNGYGASTLIYADRDSVFFEDLDHLPASIKKRVWWVTAIHWEDEQRPFPNDWQCQFAKRAGDMELRLYVIHASTNARGQPQTQHCDIQ